RARCFLPEALVNFVALLGWNPGDERELFSLEELIQEFSLERVGKSGAVFDIEKLRWMNTQHLRRKTDDELLTLAHPHIEAAALGSFGDQYFLSVLHLMKDRIEAAEDILTLSPYFFRDPDTFDERSRKKHWTADSPARLTDVKAGLADLDEFTHTSIEEVVRSVAQKHEVGAGKIIHPLRLAVSGMGAGPGIFEMMEVIGKDICLQRIDQALVVLGV
ncbi:MAG: glutamate--tRNA ligase, partial [Bacteroidetes bacterium]|nr:glutamate--tRNA ligase [Bacteroidota bacterium]